MRRGRLLALGAGAGLACAVGMLVGATPVAPAEVWAALWNGAHASATVVRDIRLPRVVLGLLVGGTLSISGASLQALIRNPLADPYLLGLSGGAGLGAVTAMAFGVQGPWGVPLAAFAGALAAVAMVYRLSLVEGRRLDPHILLLAGVVVGSFAAAVMTTIVTLAGDTLLRAAYLWLLGGLGGASWSTVGWFAAWAVLPVLALFAIGRSLDLLVLGEEPARYLGAEVERAKRVVYLATALLTAASVAACGIIGFVGLVVPHALRRLVGPLHGNLLPAVFLGGGAFLVLADAVSRSVAAPIELPVGVVTAMVGVPLFAALLRRGRR